MTELEYLESLSTPLLNDLLESKRDSDPQEALAILQLIAERAHQDDDYEAMHKWHEEIIEIAQELDEQVVFANSLYKSGFALFYLDQELNAVPRYKQAQQVNAQLGRDNELLECLFGELDCYYCIDDYESLIPIGQEALGIARVLEDFWSAGRASLALAKAHQSIANESFTDLLDLNYVTALEYAEEAHRHFLNSGDAVKIAESLEECADILIFIDRNKEAHACIAEGIEYIEEVGKIDPETSEYLLPKLYYSKGHIEYEMGMFEVSLVSLQKALAIYESSKDNDASSLSAGIHWFMASSLSSLERGDEALQEIKLAMSDAKESDETELYYRCLQEQLYVLYKNNRETEALFISRGGMAEYESPGGDKVPSHIYFAFILNAALCLSELERWPEVLEVLEKVNTVDDYLVPMNRAVRIDYLRAQAKFGIGEVEEALEILEAILDSGDVDESDLDIGDSYALRARIRKTSHPEESKNDLENALRIIRALGEDDYVDEVLKTYNK